MAGGSVFNVSRRWGPAAWAGTCGGGAAARRPKVCPFPPTAVHSYSSVSVLLPLAVADREGDCRKGKAWWPGGGCTNPCNPQSQGVGERGGGGGGGGSSAALRGRPPTTPLTVPLLGRDVYKAPRACCKGAGPRPGLPAAGACWRTGWRTGVSSLPRRREAVDECGGASRGCEQERWGVERAIVMTRKAHVHFPPPPRLVRVTGLPVQLASVISRSGPPWAARDGAARSPHPQKPGPGRRRCEPAAATAALPGTICLLPLAYQRLAR